MIDSQLQEDLLDNEIIQQVNKLFDKLDNRPKEEYKGDSYRFTIIDFGKGLIDKIGDIPKLNKI